MRETEGSYLVSLYDHHLSDGAIEPKGPHGLGDRPLHGPRASERCCGRVAGWFPKGFLTHPEII